MKWNKINMGLLNQYLDNFKGFNKFSWQGIGLVFLIAMALGMTFFISIYFVKVLHFRVSQASYILAAYGAGTMFGSYFSGKLADKMSPKLISVICLLITSATFLLLAKVKLLTGLMCILFFMGAAIFGFCTANDVWMLKQGDEAMRLRILNVSRVALNLGLGISGALIGLFNEQSFYLIFIVSGVSLLLATVYFMLQKDAPNQAIENQSDQVILGNQNIKIITLILTCLFAMGLLVAQLSTTYPIYVQELFGLKGISFLFILNTILIVLFQVPLVNVFKDHNKILLVGAGIFLMGFGLLVLTFSDYFSFAIISTIIWTIGEMIFVPIAQSVCYEHADEAKKGLIMGIYQAVYASTKLIGPIVGGYIFEYYGGNTVWYLCALICTLCLLACIRFSLLTPGSVTYSSDKI